MASGTIELTRSSVNANGSYIVAKIDWTSTQDKEANKSDVTAKLYVRKGNDNLTLTDATIGSWRYELMMNGSSVSGTTRVSVLEGWVLIATKTVTGISHDNDGTKAISISGSVTAPNGTSYSGKTTSGSKTVSLDNIPRASTITSVTDVVLSNKCSVKWTPASTAFRYKLMFSLGDWSYTTDAIKPGKTSAYTFMYAIPLEVANQIPNSKTGTMTVSLYTYSDTGATQQIGNVSTKTFTVTVPEFSDTRPFISIGVLPVHTLPDSFSGLYIQGKSKVSVFVNAYGQYGAGIETHTAKVDGIQYTGNRITSDYLNKYGKIDVSGTAVDSRGYSGTKTTVITVIPYSRPSILPVDGEGNVVAVRCDADGNLLDSGTYLKIKAKRKYSLVESDGEQHNFCKIQYRYRLADGPYSSWITILEGDSLDSDEIVTEPLLDGALLSTNTYQVQVQAIDDIGVNAHVTITVPTAKVYMHRDGARNAIGLGKYCEKENAIDSGWDYHANGNKVTGLPAPEDSTDAVPKSYFDDTIAALEARIAALESKL